jgi:hypothetical protein
VSAPLEAGNRELEYAALALIESGSVKILEADHRSGFVVAHVTASDGGVYRVSKRERWQCSCEAKSFGNRCKPPRQGRAGPGAYVERGVEEQPGSQGGGDGARACERL